MLSKVSNAQELKGHYYALESALSLIKRASTGVALSVSLVSAGVVCQIDMVVFRGGV